MWHWNTRNRSCGTHDAASVYSYMHRHVDLCACILSGFDIITSICTLCLGIYLEKHHMICPPNCFEGDIKEISTAAAFRYNETDEAIWLNLGIYSPIPYVFHSLDIKSMLLTLTPTPTSPHSPSKKHKDVKSNWSKLYLMMSASIMINLGSIRTGHSQTEYIMWHLQNSSHSFFPLFSYLYNAIVSDIMVFPHITGCAIRSPDPMYGHIV